MDFSILARTYPTPFYVYDAKVIQERVGNLTSAFKGQNVSLHYAVKANDNPAIIKFAADGGIGACLVSAGEMKKALAGGIAPKDMLMNGVGKTDEDIRFGLSKGIGQLNAESIPELTVIADIARDLGVIAPIGIRINPNVAAESTHTSITTGRKGDKFGIMAEDLGAAKEIILSRPELKWLGLSCHIGSQIMNPAELEKGYRVMTDLFRGQNGLDRLDLGGGFGVSYKGDVIAAQPSDFAPIIQNVTKDLQGRGIRIQLEPGRYIVAEAGTLITKVTFVKHSGGFDFVILDSGMSDLMRPALYAAYHPIKLVRKSDASEKPFTIVGPICESTDCFARDRMLPGDIARGDIMAIQFAGAYGHTMSNQFNARDRLAEYLVDAGQVKQIRRAISAEEFDELTLT